MQVVFALSSRLVHVVIVNVRYLFVPDVAGTIIVARIDSWFSTVS